MVGITSWADDSGQAPEKDRHGSTMGFHGQWAVAPEPVPPLMLDISEL